MWYKNEPPHDKTNKLSMRPAKAQIIMGICLRVFSARSVGSLGLKVSSCEHRRLWSDWADAQADLSLRWAHTQFVGFVMSRLRYVSITALGLFIICSYWPYPLKNRQEMHLLD